MPTYQYRCTECGRDLEVVQKFSDPSLTECPTCAGVLRKVFNAVGVVFKGSGFYRTDSRAGSKDGSDSSSDKPAESAAKADAGESKAKDSAAKEGAAKEGAQESRPKESRPSDKPAATTAGNGSSSSTGTKAAAT